MSSIIHYRLIFFAVIFFAININAGADDGKLVRKDMAPSNAPPVPAGYIPEAESGGA